MNDHGYKKVKTMLEFEIEHILTEPGVKLNGATSAVLHQASHCLGAMCFNLSEDDFNNKVQELLNLVKTDAQKCRKVLVEKEINGYKK